MKLFLVSPEPNWITDRLRAEFCEAASRYIAGSPSQADIIWSIGGGEERIPSHFLENKIFIKTIHHFVPPKLTSQKKDSFLAWDRIVDGYICPNHNTLSHFPPDIDLKKIAVIPYWSRPELWKFLPQKKELRKKYSLPNDKLIIGSFQRDTEGHDLSSPKIEKGPDIFCDVIESLDPSPHVILTAWRRQYIMKRLQQSNITYSYFELPPLDVINDLYNCLDLYLCTSRWEGGPQALLEASLSKTPVLSLNCGMASTLLDSSGICKNSAHMSHNIKNRIFGNPSRNYAKAMSLSLSTHLSNYLNYFKSWMSQ